MSDFDDIENRLDARTRWPLNASGRVAGAENSDDRASAIERLTAAENAAGVSDGDRLPSHLRTIAEMNARSARLEQGLE